MNETKRVDPNQPHYFKSRPSIAFNLDASKPCMYCGREPRDELHHPAVVRLYLHTQELRSCREDKS